MHDAYQLSMMWRLQVEQQEAKHTHCQPGIVSLVIKDARIRQAPAASSSLAVQPQWQGFRGSLIPSIKVIKEPSHVLGCCCGREGLQGHGRQRLHQPLHQCV